jgi:hypothetical protein
MARSHHRKKHKEHLRQFRHSHDTTSSKSRGRASNTFLIIGAVVGFAIGFFAAEGDITWSLIGLAAGSVLGYFIGRRIDAGGRS